MDGLSKTKLSEGRDPSHPKVPGANKGLHSPLDHQLPSCADAHGILPMSSTPEPEEAECGETQANKLPSPRFSRAEDHTGPKAACG